MKAKFNLLNKSNQSIILLVDILIKPSKNINLQSYKYNNDEIFKYDFYVSDSKLNLSIIITSNNSKKFYKKVLGSFIFDQSIKYSTSELIINSNNKKLLESIVMGFVQKDYIYSVYKTGTQTNKFKTNYKLSKSNNELLKSIKYLKQLVSEPSNIIYPESFVSLAQKNINKKK